MNLGTLKALADNGKPLDLTVTEREGRSWVSRDGGAEMMLDNDRYPLEMLRAQLAHHPGEVWINGESLPTTPAPRMARVETLEPRGPNTADDMPVKLMLEAEDYRHLDTRFNAIAGGICCFIGQKFQKNEMERSVYFSPSEHHGKQHHRFLRKIALRTHTEIRTEELDQLQEDRWEMEIPSNSDLEQMVILRRQAMRDRTMKLSGMPKIHRGPVYLYVLGGKREDPEFDIPVPMAVTGTPLVVNQDKTGLQDSELVTVVEALYRSDCELVPVRDAPGSMIGAMAEVPGEEAAHAERVDFVIQEEKPNSSGDITIHLILEDGQSFDIPGEFHLTGDRESEAEQRIKPGSMTPEELRDILVRAYWDWGEQTSWEGKKLQRQEARGRMHNLATHLCGDNETAVRNELQRILESAHTPVPRPKAPVTMTSRDGGMTITMNPGGEN